MTQTRTCTGCGREISPYAVRCIYCGQARAVMCARCKEIARDGSLFCSRCGAPLPGAAKTPVPPDTKAPAFPLDAVMKKGAPNHKASSKTAAQRWMEILVTVFSILVIVFVFQAVFLSKRTNRKTQVTTEVHELWDEARRLVKEGKTEAAVEAYAAAVAKMQYHSLDDPAMRIAVERERDAINPGSKEEQQPSKPDDEAALVNGLKKDGYAIHEPLAFLARPPGRGFYMGRLCVEIWIKVVNIGMKPVMVSRASFKAYFDNGAAIPADDVYDVYHLPQNELSPGESTSGAVLFGAREQNAPEPEHLRELTYEDKPIWKRNPSKDKP